MKLSGGCCYFLNVTRVTHSSGGAFSVGVVWTARVVRGLTHGAQRPFHLLTHWYFGDRSEAKRRNISLKNKNDEAAFLFSQHSSGSPKIWVIRSPVHQANYSQSHPPPAQHNFTTTKIHHAEEEEEKLINQGRTVPGQKISAFFRKTAVAWPEGSAARTSQTKMSAVTQRVGFCWPSFVSPNRSENKDRNSSPPV